MRTTYRILKMAVLALRRNILRSALTTLGIIIGVAAVIAMMEIGQGSAKAVQRTIANMGADNLLIQSGTASSGGVSFGSGTVLTLTPSDAEAIERECPAVASVAPVVRVRTQVIYGNRNWVPVWIYGTSPEFLDVREWEMAEGSMFSEREMRSGSNVCVLGQTLARALFDDQSPLGEEIRIRNATFRVVGVLARKGANMMGIDQDDVLLAPWTTIKYRVAGVSANTANQSAAVPAAGTTISTAPNTLSQQYPTDNYLANLYPPVSPTQQPDEPQPVRFSNVDQILVRARSTAQIPDAIDEMKYLLRQRHRLADAEADDFNIRDMAEASNALASTAKLMSGLLLCVAAISLVVGGVGIMNIMLVSVTERTREIGLRMAVGARAKDILRQFLGEAIVLCLLGGVLGIAVGRFGSFAVRILMNWPTEFSLPAIVAAVVVAVGTGVAFGYYPAWKAAHLDPIEALRYE